MKIVSDILGHGSIQAMMKVKKQVDIQLLDEGEKIFITQRKVY